jgi:hypothetical protein
LKQEIKNGCILAEGRKMIKKPMMKEVMSLLHKGNHWSSQAMCDVILRNYSCVGIYTITKQVYGECFTCQTINKKIVRKQMKGERQPRLKPFQSIQVHFTEMPTVG